MLQNPFCLGWNKGWSFLFFFEGGVPKIEAKGFGISRISTLQNGESPAECADRLVFKEDRKRKARYYSWYRSLCESEKIK